MMILSANNEALDTDKLQRKENFGVLSFTDYKNPDFFFDRTVDFLEVYNAAAITLRIAQYTTIVPLHWSVLCTDLENIQSIPLVDVSGKNFTVFCINPIDGYRPHYLTLKTGMIFQDITWACPPVRDKDMILVPIGDNNHPENEVKNGPLCAVFGPNKMEVYKEITDIW